MGLCPSAHTSPEKEDADYVIVQTTPETASWIVGARALGSKANPDSHLPALLLR